jgi:ATP-dependent Clp protease ATP-binding subunit ClpA
MADEPMRFSTAKERKKIVSKRAAQEHILNPLSMRLLEGDFKPGDKIKVIARNDELVFEKK